MKILILSDSHRDFIRLDEKKFDYVIHAGDRGDTIFKNPNTYYVRGNCDILGPDEENVVIDGKKYFITHGHLYNVKYKMDNLVYRGMQEHADIVIYGHTHIQEAFKEKGIWFINPGAYENGDYAVIDGKELILYRFGEVEGKYKL
ncbi:MAG: metallophosphoesterase [Acholeplasmatales bacterium]|nr:metallophosphoesterase [Acholeplasmatales bacterium]